MLEMTRDKKKLILAQQRELRISEELRWTSRDLEAMLQQDKSQEPVEHLKNGVKAKTLRETFVINPGEISEQ